MTIDHFRPSRNRAKEIIDEAMEVEGEMVNQIRELLRAWTEYYVADCGLGEMLKDQSPATLSPELRALGIIENGYGTEWLLAVNPYDGETIGHDLDEDKAQALITILPQNPYQERMKIDPYTTGNQYLTRVIESLRGQSRQFMQGKGFPESVVQMKVIRLGSIVQR